jgi:hypothetical protein
MNIVLMQKYNGQLKYIKLLAFDRKFVFGSFGRKTFVSSIIIIQKRGINCLNFKI